MEDTARDIVLAVRGLLAYHRSLGATHAPLTPAIARFLGQPEPGARPPVFQEASQGPACGPTLREDASPPAPLAHCSRCDRHEGRTKVVCGVGLPGAKLFLVGPWPDQEEEAAGRPFVGENGRLLAKMLTAIGLDPTEVYLSLLVKCRPANDRKPNPDEIAACLVLLRHELDAITPRIICAMGTFTAQGLLGTQDPLLRLRGRFHTFQGLPLLVSFHPSFLINQPEMKKAAWQDLQMIQKALTDHKIWSDALSASERN